MLEMMFFCKGKLADEETSGMENCVLIDAGDGYTSNMSQLLEVVQDKRPLMVFTNQIALLDNSWLWDKQAHRPRLCFKDHDGTWKPAGRFTKRDIKNLTSLLNMFLRGEFRDRSYPRAANRVPRDLLRFRINDEEEGDD